jgi:hypothetical protein
MNKAVNHAKRDIDVPAEALPSADVLSTREISDKAGLFVFLVEVGERGSTSTFSIFSFFLGCSSATSRDWPWL